MSTIQTQKFSDILLSTKEESCSDCYYKKSEDGKDQFCALGLIAKHNGWKPDSLETPTEIFLMDLGLMEEEHMCPQCGRADNLRNLLPHLNNSPNNLISNHGWTFKQIGMWLKSIGY